MRECHTDGINDLGENRRYKLEGVSSTWTSLTGHGRCIWLRKRKSKVVAIRIGSQSHTSITNLIIASI